MSIAVTPLIPASNPDEASTLQGVVARNVGAILGSNGISKARLARAIGLSGPGLTMKLNGQRPIDLADLESIAVALRVSPAELLMPVAPRPAGPVLDLAAALQITQPAVSQKLSGVRPITDTEVVVISEFLGVEPGDLFRPAPSTDGPREKASA